MVSVHLQAGAGPPLEWSVVYKMLNLTGLMVALVLTADLTAECTEAERGAQATALQSARQPCNPCAALLPHRVVERLSLRRRRRKKKKRIGASEIVFSHTKVNMHTFV